MRGRKTVGATEAARRLGVSLQQVHRLLWAGTLAADKVNGRWQVPISEIEKRARRQEQRNNYSSVPQQIEA